jgi:hypothetical protein
MTTQESIIVAAGSIAGGLVAARHVFNAVDAVGFYIEVRDALIAAESKPAALAAPADGE